jgi:hypothetical protein
LTIALAVSIHLFAIIGVFIYFIPSIKHPLVLLWSALILAVIISWYGGIANIFISLIFSEANSSSRGLWYLTDSHYGSTIQFFNKNQIKLLFISLVLLFEYNKLIKKWPINAVLIPVYIFGTATVLLFRDFQLITLRLYDMLCVPYALIIIPSFILLFKKKERFIPALLFFVYCGIEFLQWVIPNIKTYGSYDSILKFIL